MNTFDFDIIYKKGSEMPADYLSRNLVAAISWDAADLQNAQNADPLIKTLKNFLLNKELPIDPKCQQLVRLFANDCFIEDDIVWRQIKRQFEPSRVVIFLPASLKQQALVDAHGNELVGHDSIYKTKERLFQCYYWPGMDADIAAHLKACHRCQIRRTDDHPPPALLSSLPQPTEPNHRVHADLFGPLKTSDSGKKFILCMTDALTKYVGFACFGCQVLSVVKKMILLVVCLICMFLLTKVDYVVFNLEFQVSPPGGIVCVLFDALPSFTHPMFCLKCPS
jgi:hypothetical protein